MVVISNKTRYINDDSNIIVSGIHDSIVSGMNKGSLEAKNISDSIKKDFLTLSGFYNSKGDEFMDKNSPTPKNWHYNTKES